MGLHAYHRPDCDPVAAEAATVVGADFRFTVLSPRVIRMEYDQAGDFEDRPSQTIWHRDQPVPAFTVERDDQLIIETDALRVTYDPEVARAAGGFTADALAITLQDTGTTWQYGDHDDENLGGTRRALDRMAGPQSLDPGLLSRSGWTVLDDGETWVFDDEWMTPRDAHPDAADLYVFGYGHDYLAALRDFAALAGQPPLIPRWALGNWWSRYWEYSDEELLELMSEFRERDLPLSVCVVDMDWHVTDHPSDVWLSGWTWNRDLFPDPEGFVESLHEAGLRTTLNVHPADGVYPHEDKYDAVAKALGLDLASEEPIDFDATDPDFLGAYLDVLHHPFEDEAGIDFWWIDDYPTRFSDHSRPGARAGPAEAYAMDFRDDLDATWALNHLHAMDRTRNGRRPFILSRWAGLGSHRYPAAFSADVFVDWETLAFEVPFTATAGNVGFGWWSHDIGGHFGGTGDPESFGELYARWVQFGLWSPLLRLHAPKDRWIDKRPWTFPADVEAAIGTALRERHALIPYLYSLAREYHETGVSPIRPLYYHAPGAEPAYHCPQAYHVGRDVIVAPHTEARDAATNRSRQTVWLPAGGWIDLGSGQRYDGDQWHARYGGLGDVPVYARAGTILPRQPAVGWGGIETPEEIELTVVPGADNAFTLYDDAGTDLDHREGEYAETEITQTWESDRLVLSIDAARGDRSVLPEERTWTVRFRGVTRPDDVTVTVDGEEDSHEDAYEGETKTLTVDVGDLPTDATASIRLSIDGRSLHPSDPPAEKQARFDDLLADMTVSTTAKEGLSDRFEPGSHAVEWLGEYTTVLAESQLRALVETITDAGVTLIDADGHDRVVLWNPDGLSRVTYRFNVWRGEAADVADATHVESGVVPAFAVIDLTDWAGADWTLQLDYGTIHRVRIDGVAGE